MLEDNYLYFSSFDSGTLWADDFGWWGLMGINARKHLLRLGNDTLAAKYRNLSIQLCWKKKEIMLTIFRIQQNRCLTVAEMEMQTVKTEV